MPSIDLASESRTAVRGGGLWGRRGAGGGISERNCGLLFYFRSAISVRPLFLIKAESEQWGGGDRSVEDGVKRTDAMMKVVSSMLRLNAHQAQEARRPLHTSIEPNEMTCL